MPGFDGDGAGIRSRLPFCWRCSLCARRTRSGNFAAATFSTTGWLRKSKLFALLFQQCFAGKLDAVPLDAENLDQHLVPFA